MYNYDDVIEIKGNGRGRVKDLSLVDPVNGEPITGLDLYSRPGQLTYLLDSDLAKYSNKV